MEHNRDGYQHNNQQTGTIVVASCSLGELLAGSELTASDNSLITGKLHLPEYQRPYRWGVQEVNRLLNDLTDFFKDGGEAKTGHDFYLGSIILHQTSQNGEQRLNIIDGQQRLTTMALLAYCWNQQNNTIQPLPESDLEFSAPESQNTIYRNLKWLAKQSLPELDFQQINITLVVTRSEDDAYRFFETQNSGGVRLSGPDIIKAHHLRAVPRKEQDSCARVWEAMGELSPLVDALIKGRYWQTLQFREQASHRQPRIVREQIVEELSQATHNHSTDLAYRQVQFQHQPGGWSQNLAANGYAMRQPLNAGLNSIHYLQYFHTLREKLLIEQKQPERFTFHWVYNQLVLNANGSPYLKKLYDSAILLYVSQFGEQQLFEASLWLLRVIYSKRLSNQKTVRESSVQAFVRDTPVLDWIASSFTHSQLMVYLQGFRYEVDSSNLDAKSTSVKKGFVDAVAKSLNVKLPEDKFQIAKSYDEQLIKGISDLVSNLEAAV